MPNTDSIVTVTDALKTLLENDPTLDLAGVYYGEEQRIPRVPAVTVTLTNYRRSQYQTSLNYLVTYEFLLDVFHSEYGPRQLARRQCDIQAEQIEAVLHSDLTLGGLLTNSYVVGKEPGVLRNERTLMQATRISWTATSRSRLT